MAFLTYQTVLLSSDIESLSSRLKLLCLLFILSRAAIYGLSEGINLSEIRYQILGSSTVASLGLVAASIVIGFSWIDFIIGISVFGVVLLSVTRTQLLVFAIQSLCIVPYISTRALTRKYAANFILSLVLLTAILSIDYLFDLGLVERWTGRLFVGNEMGADPSSLTRSAEVYFMFQSFISSQYTMIFGNGLAAETLLTGPDASWAIALVGRESVENVLNYGFGHHNYWSVLFIAGLAGGGPLLIVQFVNCAQAVFYLIRLRAKDITSSPVCRLAIWGAAIVVGTIVFGFFGGTLADRGISLWYGIGTGLLTAGIALRKNERQDMQSPRAQIRRRSKDRYSRRLSRRATITAMATGLFCIAQPYHGAVRAASAVANDINLPWVQTGAAPIVGRPLAPEEAARLGIPGTAEAITVIDLSALPPGAPTQIARRSAPNAAASSFELFQGDARFRPARWPKRGFERSFRGGAVRRDVVLSPQDWARWGREPFLWIGGYMVADWAWDTSPVVRRDEATRTLQTLAPAMSGTVRPDFPHVVFNALGALTEPGEYVLDPDARKVYAFGFGLDRSFEVATRTNLIDLSGVRDVRLTGLRLEKTAGTALRIRDAHNVTIEDCVIRHVGTSAIVIEGGSNVTINNCLIEDTGETAIIVTGGDRASLSPAGHAVTNSTIRNFGVESRTYRPAIYLKGVGNRVEGSLLENAPHSAILVTGNDHVIRGNTIRNVVRESDDAGAIYGGRDWTERGTVISDNVFEEIGMSDGPDAVNAVGRKFVSGVYLDDRASGTEVSRNVFHRVSRPVVIHGGRDNRIVGNAFLRCDQSAIWLGADLADTTGPILEQRIKSVPYQSPLWAQRYPKLQGVLDNPRDPVDNDEQSNSAVGCNLFMLGPRTPASFLPNVGATSRVLKAPAGVSGSLDLLGAAGSGCAEFPTLCRRVGRP